MEKGERSVGKHERKRKEGSQDPPKCASKVRDDDEQELEKWVNLQNSRDQVRHVYLLLNYFNCFLNT